MEIIKHVDSVRIEDRNSLNQRLTNKEPIFGLKGWVKIYLDNKLVHEDHNLVVGLGREFVAQKIFEHTSGSNDWTGFKISHFAIGSGGATLDCSTTPYTVTLNGPNPNDEQLNEAIDLGNSAYLTEPGGTVHACKPITSIDYEQVDINGTLYYTDVKCTCTVDVNEPPSTVQVSEAGLYFVSGSTAKMFAHICFPPKWKEDSARLTIEWTIRC